MSTTAVAPHTGRHGTAPGGSPWTGTLRLLRLALLFSLVRLLRLARQLDLAPYVDRLIANGIGIDTIVYFVAAAALLAAGAPLGQWGVYRLAGIGARRALEPTDPARGNPALYATSRLLLGGIALKK